MVTGTAITKKEDFSLELTQFAERGVDVGSAIADMLGGEDVDSTMLPSLTVPGAGSTIWEMPENDDETHSPEVEGIIIHWVATRAFYTSNYGEGDGDGAPDCFSPDSITGFGNPGGECKTCPMNEWGSASQGNGKACKERRMIYILRENSLVPMVVQAPSASLKAFRTYVLAMLDRGGAKFGHTTRFGLRAARAGNRTYSQITFGRGRKLSNEQAQLVRAYAEMVIPAIEAQSA